MVRELGAATASVEAIQFSPDGKRLIVASKDETAQIWSMDSADPPVVLRGHTSWVVGVDFSPDGQRVMTGAYDGTARLWNVDGSRAEIVLGQAGSVVRFDATGSRIVTGNNASVAAVWSLDPRLLLTELAARTHICLDQTFRERFLAESPKTAARNTTECRRARQNQ
jgi:WD40 repeat protein